MFDAGGVFADVVVAQIEDGAVDHAMMRPEAGFAVADEALIGVDPHQQKSVYKKGSNLLDFHRELSAWAAREGRQIASNPIAR